jgi:hypothetical protein
MRTSLATRVRVSLIAWLAMLGVDFLLNGAIFARLYVSGGAFILAPSDAFRRIPLGYVAFLIIAVALVEFAYRLGVTGLRGGIELGLSVGAVIGVSWSLSSYSITTIPGQTAIAFAVIWIALVVTGLATAATGLARPRLRGLALAVGVFDAVCVALVIALQSFGIVPTKA